MTLRLNGSTSGYTEIDAPAVAGSNTLVLPGGNGTDGQILGTDGSGNLSWVNGRMVLEANKGASGTSVDFTGIPSWVKRVTVIFVTVSTNGTSPIILQVGSGSVSTSGYNTQTWTGSSGQSGVQANGFHITTGTPAATWIVTGSLTLLKYSNNDQFIGNGAIGFNQASSTGFTLTGYTPVLSGALDRIRMTTVNGTDAFDAGAINILYEG
jgi:hypothetical protein